MQLKAGTILIVCSLILSVLFAGSANIDANAEDAPSTRSGGAGFIWDTIEVPSEPTAGQNNNLGLSVNSKIAVEGNKVYLVWEDSTNYDGSGGDSDIFFRYYDGAVWWPIDVVSEPIAGQNNNDQFSGNPAIAVENGKIYVVWEDKTNINNNSVGGESEIFYITNLTGTGWDGIQILSEPSPGDDFNTGTSSNSDIAVDNGKIHVVWHDNNDTNSAGGADNDVFYTANLTGSGWEPEEILSEPRPGFNDNIQPSNGPSIAAENGNVYVAWNDANNTDSAAVDPDIFFMERPSGQGWTTVAIISEPFAGANNNTGLSLNPGIAVHNDNVYVVWEDDNDTNGAGGATPDVFYKRRPASMGWDPVEVISEPVFGQNTNTDDNTNPTIDVDDTGIYVVWESMTDYNGSGGDMDVFFRCNSGSGWSGIPVISEPTLGADLNSENSFDPVIKVNAGKSHVVWFDSTNYNGAGAGEFDVFYRGTRVSPILSAGNVTPAIGNTSSMFNFTVTYTDGDNDVPLYLNITISGTNYTMLEANQSDTNFADGKEYYYTTALDIGNTYTYQYWTSDGLWNVSTTEVDNPDVLNTVPMITTPFNGTATEDVPYGTDFDYEDIDEANVGQVLTWSFSTDASWLVFNTTDGALTGTPENGQEGLSWVNITLSDGIDSTFINFTINVTAVNDPPEITTGNVVYTDEDALYEVDYDAADIDNAPLELFWTVSTDATFLSMNPLTGKLAGTPANADVGTYWVNVTVKDLADMDFSNFTLVVNNTNDRPIITNNDTDFAKVDEAYSVQYTAEDIDPTGDTLSWSMASNTTGGWLTIDAVTGWLNGTPADADAGKYWVNVTVSDGNGGFDSHNFTIVVAHEMPTANLIPVITPADKLNATAGTLYSTDYDTTDDKTPLDKLVWAWATNASWLSFNTTTGLLSGTPTDADAGTYWVYISVSDDEGGIASRNFTIRVYKKGEGPGTEPGDNKKPILTDGDMDPNSGDTETDFTFTVKYYDEDGDPPESVKVVIDGKEHEMTLKDGENASNGIYEFTITLDTGPHTYYFTSSDGEADSVSGDGTPTTSDNAKTTSEVKEAETDGDGTNWALIILAIIIILVVVLMVVMVSRKPKAPPVDEEPFKLPEDEEEAPMAAEADGEGEAEGVAEPLEEGEAEEAAPAEAAEPAEPAEAADEAEPAEPAEAAEEAEGAEETAPAEEAKEAEPAEAAPVEEGAESEAAEAAPADEAAPAEEAEEAEPAEETKEEETKEEEPAEESEEEKKTE